jgi:hypothetical protein
LYKVRGTPVEKPPVEGSSFPVPGTEKGG